MVILDHVVKNFEDRKTAVLQMIIDSCIPYKEIGIFGSYSRNDYKTRSDIDFCIIVDVKPDRHISGLLREEADMLGADITFVTEDYFKNDISLFASNLRKDYKRIL